MPKRYGSRGTIITTDRNTHTSQTGSGSSSRRTSYGDVLSKRWENRITGNNPDSIEAHNIDAIRKHIILNKLNVSSQGRMNRLKQALTQPYGASGEVSYQKAKSYEQKQWESYNTGTEMKYTKEYVPKNRRKEK